MRFLHTICSIMMCALILNGQSVAGNTLADTNRSYIMKNNGITLAMVYVQGGIFKMGSFKKFDENPVHKVKVNSFYISTTEITNAQYCHFLNVIQADSNGFYKGIRYIDVVDIDCHIEVVDDRFMVTKGKGNAPVVEVTWYGAQAFCEWLGGRLPTEAEWEYAAQGGSKGRRTPYAGSGDINVVAWHAYNAGAVMNVAMKKPNELGLFDMTGNAWEWCSDWYNENYYSASIFLNPLGALYGTERVLRGGSAMTYDCRITVRHKFTPDLSDRSLGFRIVKDSP